MTDCAGVVAGVQTGQVTNSHKASWWYSASFCVCYFGEPVLTPGSQKKVKRPALPELRCLYLAAHRRREDPFLSFL